MNRYIMTVVLVCLCLGGCPDVSSTPGVGLNQGQPTEEPTDGCADGCDDGDPCTEDACGGLTCEHLPIEGCSVMACNALGLMGPETLASLDDGATWKVAATPVVIGEPTACTEESCDALNPCCNSCDAELALEVEGQSLQAVSAEVDFPWFCSVDECAGPLSCEPLALDSGYWVWGKVDEETEERYVAHGWCRKTTVDTLPGEYMGTWVSDNGEAHTVELTIGHLGNWSILLTGVRACEACAYSVPNQQAAAVTVGDGFMDFVVSVCTDGELCEATARRDVNVTLSSHRDRLIGTFQEANLIVGLGDPYAGAIGLERLDEP